MYQIDYNAYRAVKGYGRRVRFLILHYTAENFVTSAKLLAGDGKVSAHYLVPDPTEQTYIDAGYKDMRIFNLVDEYDRAWHAGVSFWAGRTNINDSSIGVEIVNLASEKDGKLVFPPFNPTQIDAVKELAHNVMQRYPDISPVHVLGHSDVAPGRKKDPGAAFPWKLLFDEGIGAWYDDATKVAYLSQFEQSGLPERSDLLAHFATYGYGVAAAATDAGFHDLVQAFQLHFRQEKYDGVMDLETAAILYALVEKYFPSAS